MDALTIMKSVQLVVHEWQQSCKMERGRERERDLKFSTNTLCVEIRNV